MVSGLFDHQPERGFGFMRDPLGHLHDKPILNWASCSFGR